MVEGQTGLATVWWGSPYGEMDVAGLQFLFHLRDTTPTLGNLKDCLMLS